MKAEEMEKIALENRVDLAMGDPIGAMFEVQKRAVDACVDMAGRYYQDMEGCDADELLRYEEGEECAFRLAFIIKYGKYPTKENGVWRTEFANMPAYYGERTVCVEPSHIGERTDVGPFCITKGEAQ